VIAVAPMAWWTDPMWIALAAIGLGGSAVFSGLEIGLYTLNRVKLAVAAERGDRRAVRLQRELAQPERLLAALLIGNNMVNYLGTVAIAALLDRAGLGPVESVVVNTAVVVPLLLALFPLLLYLLPVLLLYLYHKFLLKLLPIQPT